MIILKTNPMKIDTYIWTISKYKVDVSQNGEFIIAKKIPIGKTQQTIVIDDKNIFAGNYTILKAQSFLDNKYPNHIVLNTEKVKND